MLNTYALLLFGGDLKVDAVAGTVRMEERWAVWRASGQVAVLVQEIRRRVRALLVAEIRRATQLITPRTTTTTTTAPTTKVMATDTDTRPAPPPRLERRRADITALMRRLILRDGD